MKAGSRLRCLWEWHGRQVTLVLEALTPTVAVMTFETTQMRNERRSSSAGVPQLTRAMPAIAVVVGVTLLPLSYDASLRAPDSEVR